MKKYISVSFKFLALLIVSLFLLLTSCPDLFHTHADCDHHDDCPACNWVIHAVFILVFFLTFFGFLYVLFRKIFYTAVLFVLDFRNTALRLRSPPAFTSL